MNPTHASALIMRRSWATLLGSALVIGLLVGAAVVALDRRGGGETFGTSTQGERAAYYSAADLVSNSSRIVIATYLDSSTREVNVVSRATGLVTDVIRTDVVQRYQIVDTLKGTILPGEVQEVVNTSAWQEPARDGFPASDETYEVLSPIKGQRYVLFLRSGPLYPERDIWGFTGEPGMAVAGEDGGLQFLLTNGFEVELREMGLTAPFTATLDEIREEIARQAAAPPPTPATPAPEPTPAKPVLRTPERPSAHVATTPQRPV